MWSLRSSVCISCGGGAVQRGCACLQSGQACRWAMHGLQNQCSISALPQRRSCQRSGASLSLTISQQTLHGFPGPRGCGPSPAGILRRGTGRETIGVPYWSARAFVPCSVVGGSGCSLPGFAVCQFVWLVAGLRWPVMDEEGLIHTVVVGGLLCFLRVQLDAVLQLCICPLDGGLLHVTYCGFGFRGVVGHDPVELEWYRPPEHRLLDSGCRIRRRTSFAGGAVGPHPACCAMVASGFHVARWLSP